MSTIRPALPEALASNGALEGIRVIDLSKLWAGPALTEVLGNMGAEVIKVEAMQAPDLWRSGGARLSVEGDGDKPVHELSAIFNAVNRNKLGVNIDLTRPAGQTLLKELVAVGDVVVENYSARVMAKFGLDYEVLQEVNEEIVMISLPTFGATGPWKDFVGFAYPTEESAGFPHLTGYEDGPPMLWGPAGADAFAGVTGSIAVLAALLQRQRTGRGQYIDLSQVETIATWLGPQMIDHCWNGTATSHHGNRHPTIAPHGCYQASGDDSWLVIAAEDERQWRALCRTIGRDDWLERVELATLEGRLAHHDELDAGLAAWSRSREHRGAAELLQHAGVAAAPVLRGDELLDDSQLVARGFIEWHEREWVGLRGYSGMWAKFSRSPGTIRFPAPLFGQHNEEVLRELVGLDDEQLAALEAEEIIGKTPAVAVSL